ncbi:MULTISPECIES: NAD(P)/FAD-dependent oxidoreductase [Microbacterium]|uniref:NAD(P)/FAD-dependent oxidoreductase n=1 Tax=Microbacterium TaxID=33882 RepID=UPI00277DC5B7|nr:MULTISPECIES: FAD-dependent oxidoreductase [Microbacterium]MDQ1075869.1 3-phenylpropionate/trans-cinnamate dioxygenase ferredoxin reductase subunit [Microbacterium sp. SORGH_AS_0969]MDQ1116114.1 3-phenylpropionate/trans-cinnamate dioxygenase ferredoxin reductase subunit [Microbacterium testaceum]
MLEAYDVLVVGAGQAGVQVADSLRKGGFAGTVGIINAEDSLPYERPPLSKAFLRGEAEIDDFLFHNADWYAQHDIDLIAPATVESVDAEGHVAMLEDGQRISWGRLIWAAGGRARKLSLPGAELAGVLSLRTHQDAADLRQRVGTAHRAVIIGGGYIGLEAAAAFATLGLDVTVIEAQDRLLARVTCNAVSDFYLDLHRKHDTTVLLASGIERIVGENGNASGVELLDGTLLPADIVLVGVGLIPNVEPLAAAGATVTNGLEVDECFRTSLPDVFAIGDCVNIAHPFAADSRVRLESVPNANEHGKALAEVLLGVDQAPPSPPWFWSHQFDVKLQTVGLQTGHDDAVIRGDVESRKFSVVYLREGRVIALDCINSVADFAQGKQLVKNGVHASASELADTAVPLKAHLATVKTP